jgi:hypothetical protein
MWAMTVNILTMLWNHGSEWLFSNSQLLFIKPWNLHMYFGRKSCPFETGVMFKQMMESSQLASAQISLLATQTCNVWDTKT